MADMAPALTGAAQEAPHRIRLGGGSSSPAWRGRTGLLLLNGGGRAEEDDEPGGPLMDEAPGPLKRGVRRPLRGPREDMGPLTGLNSAPRAAPGAPTPQGHSASTPGPRDRRTESAPGPFAASGGPRERRQENSSGPVVVGPREKRTESVPGPVGLKVGLGSRERTTGCSSGPVAAPQGLKVVPGPRERRTDSASGPVAAPQGLKVGLGPVTAPLGPRERRTESTPGPERLKDGLGPAERKLGAAMGSDAAPERFNNRLERTGGGAPGPLATPERSKAGPEPRERTDIALGGNAKGHLAGRDLALDSKGRAEGLSVGALGPPATERDSAQGPVDSQDTTTTAARGPRVLCALRAAQMSSRQQELGARARRLCRRLQVIQAKQVERHVRQQLSGLVELLSERGAAGLPGSSPHIELDRLTCSSTARLRAAQGGFDSDATESSSGGESDEEEEEEEEEDEEEETTTAGSLEEERAEEEQSRAPGSPRHSDWRWAVERAAIICRWTWLQAQVSDLEFRIRQQTEIYKQIRCTKGGVVLGDSPHCEDSTARQTANSVVLNARGNRVPSSCSKTTPKAPSGDDPCNTPTPPPQSVDKQCSRLTQSENVACQNPPTTPACDSPGSQKTSRQVNGLINCVRSSVSCNGSAEDPEEVLGKKRRVDTPSASPALSDSTCVAARTRPLRGHKKRSLVRSSDVSSLSRKPQKPLSAKCGCEPPTTCILCGCKTYAKTSHPSTMALNEQISLMDPCYHPILSFPYDTPFHLHFQSLLKEDRQFRASNKLKILKLSQLAKKPQETGRSMFRDDRQYKGMSGPSIHMSSAVTPRPNPAAHQLPSLTDTPPSVSQQNSASAALKRKRFENSYDIDNIVIPMSLVAASRVEKLQYKEILTPSWRVLDSSETELLGVNPQLEDLSSDVYQDRHSYFEELERSRWDSWASTTAPQRRGSRSSNRSDGRWTPQPPNSQGSSQQIPSPDIRFQSLNDVPFSLSSAAADNNPEPYSTVQCRTRVLSWSEDTRSSTPEIPDEEEQIVQPWEPRFFPLSDRDCRALLNSPETPSRGRTKPPLDVSWPTSSKPCAWTESVDSGMSTEILTPASKEPPLPNSISVVRVRAHSGDKIASLEYFPPRPVNKR
ncbi:KAT8 regulatory NSL complex subunit 1-like isoform X2 [Rana temporaria]|uniref:KAT8 regulatory NSL complex subunit 1-like isoform X2 n=1 Tax=Rana temporaria TaxID=8407 RepID=UPI001AAC5A47|nr:KAT8 regulatory NSL complex subunit 1-like isoform X2 [Rana temporaria]